MRLPDIQPCCGDSRRLLAAGPAHISVYADASYAESIATGSWAFSVPSLQTVVSGVEPGSSVNWLEVSAAVHGLRYVACKDHTDRPVVVYTDSDAVIRVLECVRTGAEMPNKPFYNLVHGLYVEARQLTGSRVLRVARRATGDSHHTLCDRLAREALREHCRGTTWSRHILLKRAEDRRTRLMAELRALYRRVDQVENKLVHQELEVSLLRVPVSPDVVVEQQSNIALATFR